MVRALSRALIIFAPMTLLGAYFGGISGVAISQFVAIILMKLPVRRDLIKRLGIDISLLGLLRTK